MAPQPTVWITGLLFFATVAYQINAADAIEKPEYTVIKQTDDYEIRRYASEHDQVWVRTRVTTDDFGMASRVGFSRLFGYISGKNNQGQKFEMTAPVTMVRDYDAYVVSFFLGNQWTTKVQLPKADNPDVYVDQAPTTDFAVIGFGGWATKDRWSKYALTLSGLLHDARVESAGDPKASVLAQYNSPFRLFNRHNEVWIPVKV